MEVPYTYKIGSATFTSTSDVDPEDWADMEDDERKDLLRDEAMSEVDDQLEVVSYEVVSYEVSD